MEENRQQMCQNTEFSECSRTRRNTSGWKKTDKKSIKTLNKVKTAGTIGIPAEGRKQTTNLLKHLNTVKAAGPDVIPADGRKHTTNLLKH